MLECFLSKIINNANQAPDGLFQQGEAPSFGLLQALWNLREGTLTALVVSVSVVWSAQKSGPIKPQVGLSTFALETDSSLWSPINATFNRRAVRWGCTAPRHITPTFHPCILIIDTNINCCCGTLWKPWLYTSIYIYIFHANFHSAKLHSLRPILVLSPCCLCVGQNTESPPTLLI